MIFTVIWLPAAEAELARIWKAATDRRAVSLAANQIDRRLRINPTEVGESRPGNRRLLIIPPLGVLFRVLEDDCRVEVIHVWRC